MYKFLKFLILYHILYFGLVGVFIRVNQSRLFVMFVPKASFHIYQLISVHHAPGPPLRKVKGLKRVEVLNCCCTTREG